MARTSSPAGTLGSLSEGADRLPRPLTRGSTARGSTRGSGSSSRGTTRGTSRTATRKRIAPAVPENGVALEALLMIASFFDDVITVRNPLGGIIASRILALQAADVLCARQVDTTTADVLNVIIRPLTCPDSFRNNVKVLDVLMGTDSIQYRYNVLWTHS